MSKYDWSDVPDSIKFIAKDADGKFFGYNAMPIWNPFGFSISSGFAKEIYFYDLYSNIDWKDSLEERPSESKN